jgi:FAD/FMN-containing dehydrogenase
VGADLESVGRGLAARLGAQKVWAGTPSPYGPAVSGGAAVAQRAAVVVRCADAEDVRAAVRAARDAGVRFSVRGGGYEREPQEGVLTLDLAAMGHVEVDTAARVAAVGGGATAGELTAAAHRHGLAAAAGTSAGAGVAGIVLHGGPGPLTGRIGLAADNLLAARVVLADGHLVTTDETREPGLLRALRGGGGGLGVVVSMRVRLHRLPYLSAGPIVFAWSDAAAVLAGLDGFSAPELTVTAGVLPGPGGAPVLLLVPAWSGAPGAGEVQVAALRRLGSPLTAHVGPLAPPDLLALFDAHRPAGAHRVVLTRPLPSVAAATPMLLAAGRTLPSPLAAVFLHPVHGAAHPRHHLAEITAAWPSGLDGAGSAELTWAHRTAAL